VASHYSKLALEHSLSQLALITPIRWWLARLSCGTL